MFTKKISYKGLATSISSPSQSDHIFKTIVRENRFYEMELLKAIETLSPRGIAIDVGSNIGNHSLFFANHLGEISEVYAFEPHPVIFSALEYNIQSNNLASKVKAYPYALADKDFSTKITKLDPNNLGTAHLCEQGIVDVRCFAFDALWGKIKGSNTGKIGLVKMDVEDYEEKVLRGMLAIIMSDKPIIVAELRNDLIFNNFYNIISQQYTTNKINYAATPTYIFLPKS